MTIINEIENFIVIFPLFNSFDSFVFSFAKRKAGRYGSSSLFRFLFS